jgi:predicted O-methyltransferase YrrM
VRSPVRRLRDRIAFRGAIASSYGASLHRRPVAWARFVFVDRETTNFTYDIANEAELATWLDAALSLAPGTGERYLDEVRCDIELREQLIRRMRPYPFLNDTPRFGRRLGWYALVRATKPQLVVETGTADGLGTALLARAMQRNSEEHAGGRFLSFDVGTDAGWLVPDGLLPFVELVGGDIRETLPRSLGEGVDVFIHDSNHAPEHERFELELAVARSAERLVLVSDNAHATTVLQEMCARHGARMHVFRERPRRHLYPGGGIGLGVIERRQPLLR